MSRRSVEPRAARWLPLLYGLLFALGLGVSGMVQPEKVIAFLDVLGDWDPSLAFVMVGAIGVYAVAWRRSERWPRPLLAARFSYPSPTRVDARLIGGAVLFGVGWGLSGFCPGPAVVALGAATRAAAWFVPAMLAGMWLHDRAWPAPRAAHDGRRNQPPR
jgi:uncharacterized membrane protein YedE/YeeE